MKKVLFISLVILLISAMLISIIFIKDKKEENEQEKIFEEITEIAGGLSGWKL